MDILSKRPLMIEPFKLFGKAHLLTILVMVMIGVLCLYAAKRSEKFSRFFKYFLIINLIVMDISYRLWSGFYETHDYIGMFSIHISSVSVILAIFTLYRFNQKIFDVLFYWGLILVPQAIITPGIYRYGFPHLRFFHILWIHFLVIYTVFYLLLIQNRKLSPFNLKRVLIITHLYGIFIFIINRIFDTNYMFIGKKASVPSLIQYLGPWPYYIVVLDIILIILFIAINKLYKRLERI